MILVTSRFECVVSNSKISKHFFMAYKCLENFSYPTSSNYNTFTLFSYCHLPDNQTTFPLPKKTNFVAVSHYSLHSYVVVLKDINSEAWKLKSFYEQCLVSSNHFALLNYISLKYREFSQFDVTESVTNFIRTRWNLDQIILINSQKSLDIFDYQGQFPKSLQAKDKRYQQNNVSDLNLMYFITSGYGQQCTHENLYNKLSSLTLNFNAYDRIFCDVVEHHGLQHVFQGYWNHDDMYYLRSVLIRDGLMSSFPPDTSTAVFYACPQLTFVVLQRNPITWLLVIRPFEYSLWILVYVTVGVLGTICNFDRIIDHFSYSLSILTNCLNKCSKASDICIGLLQILLTSAYSGMILVCILHPLYPFIPKTFEDLNGTTNYFIASGLHSPEGIIKYLQDMNILNKIKNDMINDRTRETPAEYIEYSLSSEFANVTGNHNKFYASVMYDDKMRLWMKGRFIISKTARFLHNIRPAVKKVLPETRYFSVPAGATRLHFLMKTMKRVFTCGTWMRWYKLELNYYSNVAPIIAANKLRSMGKGDSIDQKQHRPLTINDLISVFAIKMIGAGIASLVCLIELCISCKYYKYQNTVFIF